MSSLTIFPSLPVNTEFLTNKRGSTPLDRLTTLEATKRMVAVKRHVECPKSRTLFSLHFVRFGIEGYNPFDDYSFITAPDFPAREEFMEIVKREELYKFAPDSTVFVNVHDFMREHNQRLLLPFTLGMFWIMPYLYPGHVYRADDKPIVRAIYCLGSLHYAPRIAWIHKSDYCIRYDKVLYEDLH